MIVAFVIIAALTMVVASDGPDAKE